MDSSELHRSVLVNSTNIHYNDAAPSNALFSIPEHGKAKRPYSGFDGSALKRLKLSPKGKESGFNNDDGDVVVIKSRVQRQTVFGALATASTSRSNGMRQNWLSSRPILQSFVSSHKSDVYRCYSTFGDTDTTLPYACSYSHGAKNGGRPLIAVATEQGSLIIVNTSKRQDWDYEPQRTTLQPHDNGVFDVQWSNDDSLLATASGDKSIRVSSVEAQKVLHVLRGHSGTPKCVVWDPTHEDLLSSGGRDGSICVWDLRLSSNQHAENRTSVLSPVLVIPAAHGQDDPKGGKKKVLPLPKSVTGLIYPEGQPHGLISSGSSDGILRFWDLRLPTETPNGKGFNKNSKTVIAPVFLSILDPTTMNGTRRSRGITSLTVGSGPTAGLVFASGADSRLHTYSVPSLMPLGSYGHPNMHISSFYVRVAVSPCGRWLASGSSGKDGRMFLFDVSNASRTFASPSLKFGPGWLSDGVQLQGQKGEISAVDWAGNMVASCADDHTVRIWRQDLDVYKKCISEPEEQQWNWSWSIQEQVTSP